MRKTKIICTLGPATESTEMITELLEAGMNTARLNFSHGTHEQQQQKINNFKKARAMTGIPAALLLDTKGPEIRVGNFENGSIKLIDGQEFILSCGEEVTGNERKVSISYDKLHYQIHRGDTVLIDDGKIKLIVEKVHGRDIICKVINGGKVSDKKGINVPDVKLAMEYLSDTDKKDVIFGIKNDVDYIAASFVRCKEDVIKLKELLDKNGGSEIKVISKIESKDGIENFEEILAVSDGIMVARGDMGVEIDFEKLPGIQKNIIRRCCETGKTVITATQMLESMTENQAPTRAEITDVANAVFDGTSAVMLSGETTVGRFPAETVAAMAKIIEQAELDLQKNVANQPEYIYDKSDVSDAVGHASCHAAKDLEVNAIIAITESGYTAEKMSKYRPPMPILAITPNEKTYYQQTLVRGVFPIITVRTNDWNELMKDALVKAAELEFVQEGDQVVISAGMPLQEKGRTNLMRIETV